MTIVILICQMTGGSQSLPISMLVHLLISSFLFIHGFQHFHHYFLCQTLANNVSKSVAVSKTILNVPIKTTGVTYLQVGSYSNISGSLDIWRRGLVG